MFHLHVHDISRAASSLTLCFVFRNRGKDQYDARSSRLQADKQGWNASQLHVETKEAVAFVSSMFLFQTVCSVFINEIIVFTGTKWLSVCADNKLRGGEKAALLILLGFQ